MRIEGGWLVVDASGFRLTYVYGREEEAMRSTHLCARKYRGLVFYSLPTGCTTAADGCERVGMNAPIAVRLKNWARTIKRDAHAIYPAARDPRVPWYAKVLALCVAGYALSPIDLIPDFIPVLGYLDDVIIVPLGILAVVKMVPANVIAEHRAAATLAAERPVSRAAARVIVTIWVATVTLTSWLGYSYLAR